MTMEEEILQRGEMQGLEKGMEQGLRKARIEDARKMLDHGIEWAVVTDVTGIRPEDLGD